MTVINPNSVAGINSITVQSGNSLSVHKANGELIRTITEESGISTFTSVSVGSATTDNSAAKSINIGLGASISQHVDNSLSFGTGGDERLRITSGGLVGINQNTPTHMLHVDSSNASDSTATAFFKGRIIRFDGAASAHSPRLNLSLDGTDKATILLHRTNDDLEIQTLTASPIRFSPNSTERVRITSGGLVGIGTDTPVEELHITASGYAGQVFQSARTTSTDNIGGPLWHDAGGNVKAKVQATVAGDLKFTSGGSSETARIDSNGRLIIGHTASTGEARYLQIVGTTADTSSAQLIRHSADANASKIDFTKSRNATKGSNTIVQDDDVLGSIEFRGDDGTDLNSTGASISASVDGTPGSNDMPGRLVFSTTADGSSSATERLRINSSGRVGIKNDLANTFDSNANTLCIGDGGGAVGLTFYTAASADGSHISFTESTGSTSEGMISYYQGSYSTAGDRDSMIFKTNSSERLRIDSSGRLLVNHTSARTIAGGNSLIQVEATDSTGRISVVQNRTEAEGAPFFTLGKSRGGSVGSSTIVQSGDTVGTVAFAGADGTDFPSVAQIVGQVDGTPGNNDMPGRLVVRTCPDGSDSTVERLRVTSAGDILIGNTLGGAEVVNMVGGGGGILISRSESGSPSDGQTLADLGLNSYASGQTCSSADVLIRGQADGDHSGSSAGSALLLFTKPASTGPGSSATERLRINKSGAIGIAGANYGSAGQVLTSNGSGSAVSWAAASGGKVLQVISSVKVDAGDSNSTGAGSTWEFDDSSLRVQITAANSNNVFLILASVTTSCSASVHIGLRDGGNNTSLIATSTGSRRAATSGHDQSDSHSASTVPIIGTITAGDTSQHSFYFQFSHTSGSTQTIFLNRGTNDGNGSDRGRYISSIVVMEIEA